MKQTHIIGNEIYAYHEASLDFRPLAIAFDWLWSTMEAAIFLLAYAGGIVLILWLGAILTHQALSV
jgi:hypothetical protein